MIETRFFDFDYYVPHEVINKSLVHLPRKFLQLKLSVGCTGRMKLFHYTHGHNVAAIMQDGLRSQRRIEYPQIRHRHSGKHLIEAFLEPFPTWAIDNPYWGDHGKRLISKHIGTVLLEFDPGELQVLIEEYAFKMALNYFQVYGQMPLDMGIDTRGPTCARIRCLDSMIPLPEYGWNYIAPIAKVLCHHPIHIPPANISLSAVQPLQAPNKSIQADAFGTADL